jgi:hypothetical protein
MSLERTTGVPTVQAPNVVALTESSNATAATQQATLPTPAKNDSPSVIIVEVLGYGGGEGSDEERRQKQTRDDRISPRQTGQRATTRVVRFRSRATAR